MKKFVILAAAAAILSACCNCGGNAAIDNMMSRKSVRSYTDRKISDEDMTVMLKAAMAAPTGRNVQPWSFVVLTDTTAYDNVFGERNFNLDMFKRAAAVVVFCADTTFVRRPREGEDFEPVAVPNTIWRDDMGACTENFLLAAESLGLGAVWTACYPYKDRYEPVKASLGLPAEVLPYSVVAVGYPDSENTPKDKWKPVRIHYGRW